VILVTGATGFLGRRVCRMLDVRGIPYRRTSLQGQQGSVPFDLTDRESTHSLFVDARPRITEVLHCASYGGGIQFNYEHPVDILRRNMLMTLNLWDMAVRTGVHRIINPISNCAYPGKSTLFLESEFWDGPLHDSVLCTGFTRKAAWVMSWACKRQHGLDTVNLVLSNMYGPEDHFDAVRSHALGALVAKTILAKLTGAPHVNVWGTGTPVREWLYVDDAAEAMIRALDIDPYEGPVNIGTGNGISVREMAEAIKRAVGYKGRLEFDASKPDGAACKTVDGSLGMKLLGWSPQVGLHEGIKRTVNWVMAHPEVLSENPAV
jgi:GDP-L-fucose synthase